MPSTPTNDSQRPASSRCSKVRANAAARSIRAALAPPTAVDVALAYGLTLRTMSSGLGRALLVTIACAIVCFAGRVAGQTSPDSPASAAATADAADATQAPSGLPKVEPSPEAVERARTAYAAGQEAFAREDYEAALQAFEEAYTNVSNPIVLLSIAESAAKLGHIVTALGAYDAYLKARPDAPDREEVAQKRAALAASQTPAQLSITSEPAGAEVVLDGQLLSKVTPLSVEVRPGEHRVSLVLTGYETARLALALAASAREERSVVLKSAPGLVAPAAPQVKPSMLPSSDLDVDAAAAASVAPPRAAIITTASLGAAGVIAGTVLGIFALKERSDFNNDPTEAGADRGERLALFSDVGFGVGAMSLITTAVLLFTHDEAPSDNADTDSEEAWLQLIPSVSARSASATARVRF